MRTAGTCACLVVFALAVPPAFGQSLADIARKEEARRKGMATSSKTYGNEDLAADPNPPSAPSVPANASAPPSSATAPAAPAAPGSTSPDGGSAAAPAGTVADEKKLNEAEWRSRAAGLRARIQQARGEIEAFSGAAHQDPREQAKVEKLLLSSQGVLERAEAAQRQFEIQAAAAGVPKLWIQ